MERTPNTANSRLICTPWPPAVALVVLSLHQSAVDALHGFLSHFNTSCHKIIQAPCRAFPTPTTFLTYVQVSLSESLPVN